MSSTFLSLPNEVLVEKFSYLDPRDIAACWPSCRQLNDIIVHSQLLQYLIRVGRSGLHDPLFPIYTISQRIKALEKWETAWDDVEKKSSGQVKYKVACPFEGRHDLICRILHDFLIMTRSGLYDDPGYGYVDLRAFQPEGGKCSWTMIANHSWRGRNCFFVSFVEQDLVLVFL